MSRPSPVPSADEQLAFLAKLQRIFAEGDFAATYKFALLIALADLAVEYGKDDASELSLTRELIAKRFVSLYWRHGVPFSGQAVLVQNNGKQAAVLNAILQFRSATRAQTIVEASLHKDAYSALVRDVGRTVWDQPIKYLQNFEGATHPFLYELPTGRRITLRSGVAFCLRRFHSLIQQLGRAHWVDHIKANPRNRSILGEGTDLEDFLFATSRASLARVRVELLKLDGHVCFYCRGRLDEGDVDHYIPFAMYGRDLAHNFVLAHEKCNRSKSDNLAALQHLERWMERCQARGDDLSEIGARAGFSADFDTSRKVASWAYGVAHASGSSAWVQPRSYEPVNDNYLAALAAA